MKKRWSGLNSAWKGMLAAFTASTLYGFSFLFSQLAYNEADQYTVLAWRMIIVLIVMSAVHLAFPKRFPLPHGGSKKSLLPLMALGLWEPCLYFVGESKGMLLTTSSYSAVMVAMIPILCIVLDVIFLKERINIRQIICALLSVSGVIIIALVGSQLGTVNLVGTFYLLIAIATAAAFNVSSRKLSGTYTAFQRTYSLTITGSLFFSLLAVIRNMQQPKMLFVCWQEPNFVWAVCYLALTCTLLATLLRNYALSYLPTSRATSFSNWTTIVSVSAGIIFLKESFTLLQVVGALLILLGLWGVNRFAVTKQQTKNSAQETA